MKTNLLASTVSILACLSVSTHACPWQNDLTGAEAAALPAFDFSPAALPGSPDPTIYSWKLNVDGSKGNSPNTTVNSFISNTAADVQSVYYDSTYAYVKHTGVASHATGRADGNNTGYSSNLNRTSRIPRNPALATTPTTVGNGAIGVMVNGALFFNPGDAQTYNNLNTWRRSANQFEAATFDTAGGHVAPGQGAQPSSSTAGTYHYHIGPAGLLNQLDANNTGQHHSPVIGFAFDGFPIYGPYGYTDASNSSSAIRRITSGYRVRTDLATLGSLRTSTTNGGTTLAANLQGPAVSATYPAGSFLEDYEFAGGNDLNEYNARFCVTPEYPQGTWAYFMTVNASGTVQYPYIVGPKYLGILDTTNVGPTGGRATIPTGSASLRAGDANLDNKIDTVDFNLLLSGFAATSPNWTGGDFNHDDTVTSTDFALLVANFGATAPTAGVLPTSLPGTTVPEPAAALILLALPILRRSRAK